MRSISVNAVYYDGKAEPSPFLLHHSITKGQPVGCPFVMEQVMRIELTTTAWEAVVLPLNYTCTSEQTSLNCVFV